MKAPLSDMLKKYCGLRPVRMHMPAHKGKFGESAGFDITELPFSDDLNNPCGAIAESQRLYADLLGAKFCHYLVNGTTSGLFALAFLAGNKTLVESNCHISLTNGLKLANKQYTTVVCTKDEDIVKPVTVEQIATVVEGTDIDTVFVTSPTYFGDTADLKNISKYLKGKKIKLFVDSAHGAHFGLSKLLPKNACEFCDAAVESTHKTLGSMTQTAVLLTNDAKLAKTAKEYLNLITTTSPSFVLLESIERAAVFAEQQGKAAYEKLFNEVTLFKNNLRQAGFYFYNNDDFTRIVIDCQSSGVDGYDLYASLMNYGVFCEYATRRYIVAILSLFDSGVSLDAFASALKKPVVSKTGKKYDYIDRCFGAGEEVK